MHAVEPTRFRPPGTLAATALVLAALLALAGCGATGDMAIPRPAAAPGATGAPGPGVASPPAASPAASGAGVGGPGTWAAIKDHIDDPAVALVGMVDGCRRARIETTLDSSSAAVGVSICNKAAEVAYASGVSTITVTAADAREIAAGANGSPCTRVP
jgi:hypothetical protein